MENPRNVQQERMEKLHVINRDGRYFMRNDGSIVRVNPKPYSCKAEKKALRRQAIHELKKAQYENI